MQVADSAGQTATQSYAYTVTPAPPSFLITPPTLTFSYRPGDPNPTSQALPLTTSDGTTVAYTTRVLTGNDWLAVSPASGTAPGQLTISATPGSLTPGPYTGTFVVSAAQAANPLTVTVTLMVNPPPLTASPASLTFTSAAGLAPFETKSVKITAKSSQIFLLSTQGAWLSAIPDQSTTDAVLAISVDASNLTAGVYNGLVVVMATGSASMPVEIPITLNVLAAPTLSVYPKSLTFRFPLNSFESSSSQSLSVTSPAGATPFKVFADGKTNSLVQRTLTLSSGGGTTPQMFFVAAVGSNVAQQQSGQVVVTSPGAVPSQIVVPVNVIVNDEPPKLAVAPQFIRANVTQSNETAYVGRVLVSNLGEGELSYSATAEGWTGFSLSGQVEGRGGSGFSTASGVIDLQVNTQGFLPGQYAADLKVCTTDNLQCETVVILIIVAPQSSGVMQLSQTALQFLTNGQADNAVADYVLNLPPGCTGPSSDCYTWKVMAQGSASANGFTVIADAGAQRFFITPFPEADTKQKIFGRGLVSANFIDSIGHITTPVPGSPQQFTVASLQALPDSNGLAITDSANTLYGGSPASSTLYFSDGGPGSCKVFLSNLTDAAIAFSVTSGSADGAKCLSVSPERGSVAPQLAQTGSATVTVVIKVTSTGLPRGDYQGVVRIMGSDGSVQTLTVILTVKMSKSPGVPSRLVPSSTSHPSSVCVPTELLTGVGSLQEGFSVSVGDFVSLQARVFDDCLSPVQSGTLVAFFSNGDRPVELQPSSGGVWGATWSPHGSSALPMTITLAASSAALPHIRGRSQLTGIVQPPDAGAPPWIDTIADLSGLQPAGIIAQGATIVINGERLAASSATATAASGPAEQLNGVTVTIGDPFGSNQDH